MRRHHAWAGPLAAGVIGMVGTLAPSAPAQMVFTATQSIGGGEENPRISSASVRDYADLLGLDEMQRELLASLHEGYAAEATAASEAFQDAMLAARQAFEDTGDGTVFMEVMPEARRQRAETMARLERQLFDDLALLLTPEQAERLPRLERLRRRETLLPGGSLSGESVDLVSLVDGMDLGADVREAMEETIVQYEIELDRALVSRNDAQTEAREAMSFGRGGRMEIGPEEIAAMEENAAKTREAALVVKGVNDRYARILMSQLPESTRDDFQHAYHEQSFPQVYRPSSVHESLEAASAFADLTPEQRRAIEDLMAAYEREAANANRRWADAIEESERNEEGATAFGPGMMMRIGREDDSSPVGEARKARRELDQRMREKLLASLTEDQRERLPRRREREVAGWVPSGGAVVGERVIIEIDDGGG